MSTLHCPLPTLLPAAAPRRNARLPGEHPPTPPDLTSHDSPLKTRDSSLAALLNLLTRLGFSVRALAVACDLSATDLLDFIEDPGVDDTLDRLETALERTLKLRLLDSAITAVDELEKLALATEEHPTERRRAATTILRAVTASFNPSSRSRPDGARSASERNTPATPRTGCASPMPAVPGPRRAMADPSPAHHAAEPCGSHTTSPNDPLRNSDLESPAPAPLPLRAAAPPRERRLQKLVSPDSLTSPSAARSPAGSRQHPQPSAPSSARAARPPPTPPQPPGQARTRSA